VAQQQTTPTKMVKKDHKYSDERYRSQNRMFSSENERSQRSSRRTRNTRTRPRGRQRVKSAERIITTKVPSQIELGGSITVKGISDLLKTDVPSVIKKLMGMGVMAAMNQEIDLDTATLLAQEFGSKVVAPKEAFDPEVLVADIEDKEEDLMDRAPVVTVMGHVDHGKTSLLDAIRSTNVVSREAGGITQHIGAHTVEVQDKKITFLDTPGHEAFTMMRARGAQVTDIAILVVAADDGVMPQTIEAINHAKNADVPIVVAINKIDRPQAQPERVKQELTEHGLIAEEWGGDTIMVNVSALRKEGIELLLESVILLAEILELKANPKRKAVGTVIEAKLDKGRGPVASVLVHKGTLRIGDTIVVGRTYGRVRAMVDDKGQRIEEAGPSTPVEVLGLNEVPDSSDTFNVVDDERQARQLAETRASNLKLEEQRSGRVTLEDLFSKMSSGEVKELNIILKADVHGSVEAIRASLERLSTPEIRVNIVHTGVGAVSESDVMLASASNAIIFGFNVRPDLNATKVAEAQEVDIRTYRVIYEIVDDVEAAMKGMLAPVLRERVIGHVEIRDLFKISRLGTIAGCYVNEGRVTRNSMVRVIRDGTVIHEGAIESLRRIKDDVREVATGYECGIMLERFNDIKVGDRFEVYINEEIRRTEL
jgi:translation initiation factor IF-2